MAEARSAQGPRVGVAVHGDHVKLGGPPELVQRAEQAHEIGRDRLARAVREEHGPLGPRSRFPNGLNKVKAPNAECERIPREVRREIDLALTGI